MAEKVTVRGGGTIDGAEFNNAATEATLLRLLDAMKGKKDGFHGDEAKLRELASKALRSNTNLVDESSVAYIGASKTVSGMATAAKTAGSAIGKLGDMGATLVSGVFSMAVTAGSRLVGFFTDSLDAFRDTSSVGAGFNNSLVDLRIAAAEAAMPLDQFTDMIRSNSKLMGALGGTVSQGAADFGKMSKEIRTSDFGQKMQGLGFTTGDLNDYLSGYLETQMRSGKINKQIGDEERAGAQAYMLEMDKLTKVTGLSRQQTQDTLRTAMKDGRALNLSRKLNGDALKNFNSGLVLMNSTIDPAAMGSLTNMMSGVIDPGDKFAKILEQATPGVLNFQEAMGRGEKTAEDVVEQKKRELVNIENYLDQQSKMGVARTPELIKLEEYAASLRKFKEMDLKKAAEAQLKTDNLTKLVSTFTQTWDNIVGQITAAFLTGDTFKKIQDGLNLISGKLLKAAPEIGKMLSSLVTDIDKAFNSEGSIWDGITSAFSKLFDKLTPIVGNLLGNLFKGGSGDKDKKRAELEARKSKVTQNANLTGTLDDAVVKKELAEIQKELDGINSGAFDGLTGSLKNMFPILEPIGSIIKGVAFAFENWGWILGGLVLGGGALALLSPLLGITGAGLSALLTPIALVAAAIGLGAGGLGAMFWGVSKVIDAFVEGFKSIPVVIGELIKLDASKMKEVGVSLGLISGPMAKLAGGGILAALGGASGLGSVAEALKKFEAINAETITGLVKPLKDFKETLDLYTGGGILSSFATGIGSLFKGDSGLGKLAEGFKSFNGIDSSGLERLSKFDNSSLKDLGLALNVLADPLLKITASSGIMSLFGSNGLGAFADSFTKLNQIDGQNIRNVVGSIESIKTVVGADFSAQAASVNTFTDSIKNLNKAITELNTALSTIASSGRGILGGGPSNLEVVTRAIGGANTGGSAGSEKLNTLVTELISLTKEIKDYSKDQADALNGRRTPI
jgi:hypothetical protein